MSLMKKYFYSTIGLLSLAIVSLAVCRASVSDTTATATTRVALYHHPGCMCCERYADYLNNRGYDVAVIDTRNMAGINRPPEARVLPHHAHW